MKILTAAEMGAADRHTMQESGVPLGELLEAAGSAVAAFCLRQYPASLRVTVLCGKGNNGGDGFVAARVLAAAGKTVTIVLLGRASELKGEALIAWGRLQTECREASILEVEDEVALSKVLNTSDLVVDAVVGTGFKPPLRGLALTAGRLLEELDVPVVAVDLPSGWDADSMDQTMDGAFRADAVVTFTAPKL